jgi:hypothetical protein
MATTGSLLTLVSFSGLEHDLRANAFRVCREGKPVPTFPDHAAGNKKAPDLLKGGASVQVMRPFNYARTTPEAREGLPVFVVVFADVIMARDHMGKTGQSSTAFAMVYGSTMLHRTCGLRDKPSYEPSRSFPTQGDRR